MGLDVNIGKRGNLLDVGPDNVASQVSSYRASVSFCSRTLCSVTVVPARVQMLLCCC